MQNFHHENINKLLEGNTDEISTMINDFVQMWTRFEVMVQKELTKTYNFSAQNNDDSDMNYGLFFRVSNIIYPKNQLTMGELSSELSVPFSKATRIVNWLVDTKLAVRLSDPSDRRVVKVSLSDKGKELHLAIGAYTKQKIEELISTSLTESERVILLTLINRVVTVLKTISI